MADDPTTPDSALALDIKETLTGRAGPEVSAVTLGNVPPGAVLSAGADNGDGTWSLTVADLEGLTITPPPRWTGEINLVVSALTKSDDAATLPTTAFGISVMPAGAEVPLPPAPEPEPPPAPEPGIETPIIGLEIDTGLEDEEAAEDIAVIISGVPAGAALSAGSDAGGGTWILTAADLSGLGLRPPADAAGDFILGIAVTRTDEVVASGNLVVTVDGSLPATPDTPFEPEPEPASGPAPASETVPGAPGPAPAAYWNLDEMVPGRAADEIGGHHGLTHGVEDEDAPGPFDAVAVFDGVDDCIEIPHAEALAPAGGTLTVWFNAFATGGGTLAAKGAGGFALRLDNGRLTFGIPSPEGPREIDAGPFGANEWNQATVTWGTAGMKTYLNGQLIASDDHAGGLTGGPAPWFFGAAETAASEGETRSLGDFFHGELDDIAIYAGQLSDAEVRDLGHFGIDGEHHRTDRRRHGDLVGANGRLREVLQGHRLVVPLDVVTHHDRGVLDAVIPLVGGDPHPHVHDVPEHHVDRYAIDERVVDRHRGVLEPDDRMGHDRRRLSLHLEIAVRHGSRLLFVDAGDELRVRVAAVIDHRLLQPAERRGGVREDVRDVERFHDVDHEV